MRVRHSTLAASALAIGVSLPAETVCDTGVSMADIPLTTARWIAARAPFHDPLVAWEMVSGDTGRGSSLTQHRH